MVYSACEYAEPVTLRWHRCRQNLAPHAGAFCFSLVSSCSLSRYGGFSISPAALQQQRANMSVSPENRKRTGNRPTAFKPGQSGNPGGRPKLPEDVRHVREIAREHTMEAIKALADVLRTGGPAARVAAANSMMDRGWGKAEQPVSAVHSGKLTLELTGLPWLKQSIQSRNSA